MCSESCSLILSCSELYSILQMCSELRCIKTACSAEQLPFIAQIRVGRKSRKGPHDRLCLVARQFYSYNSENFFIWFMLFLGIFWNGTWRPARILIFDPLVLQTKTQEKNVSLGLGCIKFQCVFLATPTEECRVALRRPCYHLEMRRHMKYTPIIIKLRPREPANEVDSVR